MDNHIATIVLCAIALINAVVWSVQALALRRRKKHDTNEARNSENEQ